MTGVVRGRYAAAVVLAIVSAAPACAQNLEARIRGATGDVVQFHYAARDGVCGDGRGMLRVETSTWVTSSGTFTDASRCEEGPVRAVVTKDGAEIIRIQLVAGPVTVAQGAADLGAVSAADAARYFLDIARRVEGRTSRTAVLGAAMADSAEIADQLLQIARDGNRARELRNTSLSWASRRAGVGGAERVATALDALARDANEHQTLRATAVGGLVNIEGASGVAALMRLTEVESDAWLAGEAANALTRTSDTRVRGQLRRLVERAQTPEASRVRMITALGNTDGTVRDAEFLRGAYAKFTEKERSAAITAVGNIGDRASVTWLLTRASDPAEIMALRRSALQRAARSGARVNELVTLFDAIPERELRGIVIDALAEDGSRAAFDKLMTVARSDADAQVRRRAITKLTESGDPRAKELLRELVDRPPG
jgi:hypothetical protein